jgi:hypothetical protein
MSKLVILSREHKDAIDSIKVIPGVAHVELSRLYSLQGNVLTLCDTLDITSVIIVDMALRYDDVVDFLNERRLSILELHIGKECEPEKQYSRLTIEKVASLDAAIERIARGRLNHETSTKRYAI